VRKSPICGILWRPGDEETPTPSETMEGTRCLTKTPTTIRSKTYPYDKVVESVRVKHRVLWSLGALTEAEVQKIRACLASRTEALF